jgi:hypothetical protein
MVVGLLDSPLDISVRHPSSLTALRLPFQARSHPSVRLYARSNSGTAEMFFMEFMKLDTAEHYEKL